MALRVSNPEHACLSVGLLIQTSHFSFSSSLISLHSLSLLRGEREIIIMTLENDELNSLPFFLLGRRVV
jgi:hypothetical protein